MASAISQTAQPTLALPQGTTTAPPSGGKTTINPRTRLLRRWIARSRQRPALAELDDRLLRDIGVIRERDIGVSREAARREIELFWRI